tara:strand:+ start:324 stop:572 length:249 start_codon:yes stop_codon:yes gene_type:complete
MKVLIENEGDMELGVAYATQLAKEDKKNTLTYHFRTDKMMEIFVSNLVMSYVSNEVPVTPKLFLELVCPYEDDDTEMENEFE